MQTCKQHLLQCSLHFMHSKVKKNSADNTAFKSYLKFLFTILLTFTFANVKEVTDYETRKHFDICKFSRICIVSKAAMLPT